MSRRVSIVQKEAEGEIDFRAKHMTISEAKNYRKKKTELRAVEDVQLPNTALSGVWEIKWLEWYALQNEKKVN